MFLNDFFGAPELEIFEKKIFFRDDRRPLSDVGPNGADFEAAKRRRVVANSLSSKTAGYILGGRMAMTDFKRRFTSRT